MKAVYAGSFDPFTNGHLEIVWEAAKLFDAVLILCAVNPKKSPTFSRRGMVVAIDRCLRAQGLSNVRGISSDALTADVCARYGAEYLVRGLRNTGDYLYEEEIARFNQKINPGLKTIYFRAVDASISSTMVKELFSRGKDVSEYVPMEIAAILGKEEL